MGLCIAQRPAAVDDFLRAALHLRVAALHRGEIQIRAAAAAADRGGGAAAQADQHGRAAEHHQLRADRHLALLHMSRRTLPRPPASMMGL